MADTADADDGDEAPRDATGDVGEADATADPDEVGDRVTHEGPDEDPDEEPDAGGTEDRSTAERLRELGSYIKEQRSRAQYSLRHLARVAGVSNPYLSQIERGLRKPSAEILQAIAKGLQISSETLYVKAGLLDEPSETPDLEVAILHEDSLTERQRAALIEVYRSFRLENEHAGDDAGDDDGEADDAASDPEVGGPPADGARSEAG